MLKDFLMHISVHIHPVNFPSIASILKKKKKLQLQAGLIKN